MTHPDTLTDAAFDRMMGMFQEYEHNPSDDLKTALRAIQGTLTAMLIGKAGRKYHLSRLDPGVGKTTAIVSWLKTYMEMYQHCEKQGVLICLDRLDEIKRYVEDCSLPETSYAVLVGKTEVALNSLGLGSDNINNALVLFTTKEQIRRKSQGMHFDSLEAFYFNDKPRVIKIWDESLTVGKEVILDPSDLGRLLPTIGKIGTPDMYSAILSILCEVRQYTEGSQYKLPELPERTPEMLNSPAWKNREEKEIADLLWRISGQVVTVRLHRNNQIIIDCVQSIPTDFPPCIILDASGRLKETYRVQEEELNNLERLPYSNKSYRNLTVNVWRRGGGREIIKDLKTVAPEIAKIIMETPIAPVIASETDPEKKRDFLFLLYKDHVDPLKAELSKFLSLTDLERLAYGTWGALTATNKFQQIPNIIALSAFQYPDYAYEARARAAGLLTTCKGSPTQEQISAVKRGEISSDFLQGVTRGKVRKSEGDTCPPCRLWLIAHPGTGLEKELPTIFPGCQIQGWKTQVHTLTKEQQKAFNLVNAQVAAGLKDFPCAPIRNQLGKSGMKQSNFKTRILEDEDFKAALASIKTISVAQADGWHFQVVA